MEEVTVKFNFDLDKLNNYLGNTPNVTAKDALSELLKGLYDYDWVSCGNCGRSYQDDDNALEGSFQILESIDELRDQGYKAYEVYIKNNEDVEYCGKKRKAGQITGWEIIHVLAKLNQLENIPHFDELVGMSTVSDCDFIWINGELKLFSRKVFY